MNAITICHWNANGLSQHVLEVTRFLVSNNIDILLISETHLTFKNCFRVSGYKFYDTKHPDGKACGGSGVLVRNTIQHYEIQKHCFKYLQATSICVISGLTKTVVSAIYCPPKFAITSDQFRKFFTDLGPNFLVAGDFNAKHTFWGSRLITPRGRQLYAALGNSLDVVSSGHPTYWPSDNRKIPDLIDFAVINGMKREDIAVKSSYDLSSDHSPVILTLTKFNTNSNEQNKKTLINWRKYINIINEEISYNSNCSSPKEIDKAVDHFTKTLNNAVIKASQPKRSVQSNIVFQSHIDYLISRKRQARREWQRLRSPTSKQRLNKASKDLKKALSDDKNRSLQEYLESLGPLKENNYSLWKATKKFKTPIQNDPPLRKPDGSWARNDEEKGCILAEHLKGVFQPNPQLSDFQPNIESPSIVETPLTLCLDNVKETIRTFANPKKAPGYDKITDCNNAGTMNINSIIALSIEGLRGELRRLNLNTEGKKQELREILIDHYQLETRENVEDKEIQFDKMATVKTIQERSLFTLRDVEDSLTTFAGVGQPSVKIWVEQLEEMAISVNWNDQQKFIYAKQLLKGAAKLFVRSQLEVKDWVSLKKALIAEFTVNLTMNEVHAMLKGRRKKPTESLREYLYSIIEIANQIQLDEMSIIDYFIEGIPDNQEKHILVIKHYRRETSNRTYWVQDIKIEREDRKDGKRCYRCGGKDHIANSCKIKDYKCFKCQEVGHKAFECKRPEKVVGNRNKNNSLVIETINDVRRNGTNRVLKDLGINGKKVRALIDTGSDVCIIRHSTCLRLGNIVLEARRKTLTGIGGKEIKTLGSFITLVDLDGIQTSLNLHVLNDDDVQYDAIIGSDILEIVDILISSDDVKFLRKSQEKHIDFNKENVRECENEVRNLYNICVTMERDEPEVVVQSQLNHLPKERKEEVINVIKHYKPNKKINNSPVTMKLILTDEVPVFHRPRRLPLADQQTVESQIREWLKEGIIKESMSEYASPVVLVAKKDGSKRLCCDYRKLNSKIIRDNFPMPLIDDILQKLQSAVVYSTLDLRNGFFHVPIEEDSRKFTAFVTHGGQYEFLFAPFGIKNSPAVFTRYVYAVLRELIKKGVAMVYMDDIIIPSQNEEEGMRRLVEVLEVAQNFGLNIKWEKCQILKKKVNFLGFIIENSSIKPNEEKLKAVRNFPMPRDNKEIQRFVGLTSYFRKFVYNYAVIAKPLSDLLRKNVKFEIKDEQKLAAQQLKTALISAPILKLFDPKAKTEVHTDACSDGYGAILLQWGENAQLHPVEFLSRKTSSTERRYHSYELEVLAIIESLKKWRYFLLGIKFKIVTDCKAFACTLKKDDVPTRVARWALFLQDFDYEIEHRMGTNMKHVDALSRVYCLLLEDSLCHRIKNAQLSDDWTKAMRKILETQNYGDFYLKHDILFKDNVKERMVIPSSMENEIIEIAHRQGHFGSKKTQDIVEKNYYISNINPKVDKVVRGCIECLVVNSKSGKKEGFLNPIDKGNRPLETYHIDHVGPLDQTKKKYNYILTVVDSFSKFVWLYPTKSVGVEEVIERLNKQSMVFGNPAVIISDRGTAFTASRFKEYCTNEGIKHLLIATGVPRGNGQVERIHRTVITMLSKLCVNSPESWYKHVERVQQAINSTPARSTQYSPFKILTGVEMRIKTNVALGSLITECVMEELFEGRNEMREQAKENLQKIAEENRNTYNKGRKEEVNYEIDDLVVIKRTQYGTGLKLKQKYLGPYRIVEKKRRGRYVVERVGNGEGSKKCETVAEHMKAFKGSSGTDDMSG
ncbi:uncharacterized protein LOC119677070 [Teleopsis dalmanni]|uniref:uncharacterized protein LOC119677070 n=1 Tax=Teleopsis dalmanni TaxID=139649 RepID=UPI0018CE4D27|nr:uncharacterized protein LOC119677070 [Teleopsis dalmanni]